LAAQVSAGVGNGLSREEIEAAITHLTLYAGLPRAQDAIRTARDAFAQLQP
jgi:alkylhydroperoxidase/carboxymuconolactone decarboxylase family protein YurZ